MILLLWNINIWHCKNFSSSFWLWKLLMTRKWRILVTWSCRRCVYLNSPCYKVTRVTFPISSIWIMNWSLIIIIITFSVEIYISDSFIIRRKAFIPRGCFFSWRWYYFLRKLGYNRSSSLWILFLMIFSLLNRVC